MVITLCFHLETIKGTRFSQLVVFLFSFTRIIYSSSPSDCESGELARGDCYTLPELELFQKFTIPLENLQFHWKYVSL